MGFPDRCRPEPSHIPERSGGEGRTEDNRRGEGRARLPLQDSRWLLLELLYSRSGVIDSEEGHTDDALLFLALQNRLPVLTVDRVLKKRLVEGGCSYIEVTSGPTLRMVEA